jgi:dimethylamine/trimethylamine dehydrogenase
MHYTGEDQLMMPMLHRLGVEMHTDHVVSSIEPGVVHCARRAVREHTTRWEADAVVLTTQRVPEVALYRELKDREAEWEDAGIQAVYRVGDCLSPRQQVADAIFDGHRLAREIDGTNPMIPKPWIREERFLGTSDSDYDAMVGEGDVVLPRSG